MGYKFNPFTGNLDTVDSPNGVFEAVEVNGDITLDDGGTYTTTLQTITPTLSNKTISLPDATGTVALVAGSSGQVVWNNAGANAGASTLTYDGSILTTSGWFINSYNATASAPAKVFTGTWFTGGTSTTTKPQVLIEPAGTSSTSWSTSGTGLGVNAASGFAGRLLDLQVNGTSRAVVTGAGNFLVGTTNSTDNTRLNAKISVVGAGAGPSQYPGIIINGYTGTDQAVAPFIDLGRSRGTVDGSYTEVVNNDVLGYFVFRGADGAKWSDGASISASADGDWTTSGDTSDSPGRLVFSTTPDGSELPVERMRIKASGVINFSNAPTYADNTAALAGGLVAGDVYKTSAGDLRITV